jgi:serine phosphatase RsbU (regulator of sigma subunit)
MREGPGEPQRERADGEPDAPEATEALAALVAKLRTELAGVRTAMRNRAVIEQAKGVLVERLGVSPDEGFDHLVRLSQRANIKLIEVAATIVGTTAPDPQGARSAAPPAARSAAPLAAGQRGQAGRGNDGGSGAGTGTPAGAARGDRRPVAATRRPGRPPALEALQAQHQLISSRIAAASTFDEVAEVIGTSTTGWPAPATVVITLLEPDAAHRFVGAHGISAHTRSEWARVPPQFDVPIVTAARERAPLLLTDPELITKRFPVLTAERYGTLAVFAAPLLDGDRVVGSLGLSWREPVDLDEDTRRYLVALAPPVARKVAELASRPSARDARPVSDQDPDAWLPIMLEAVADPAMVLAPVWEGGRLVDFQIGHANPPAAALISPARAGEGATLLAAYPRVGSELLLPRFADLLRSGGPLRLGPARLDPPSPGRHDEPVPGQFMTVQAGRVWDRVLMTWRVHSEAELIHPQLLDAERIARIGSFCWELDSPQPRCSPQLYRMYHGDGSSDPIGVDELASCVHEDDLAEVRDAVSRTLSNGEQLTREFRGSGPLSGRRLRIDAAPVLDAAGTVTTIRGTVQDVTDERAVEGRLRLAEEALTAQRLRVDAELRAAQALQRALMPTDPELGATEGLWVTGRSRSSQHSGRVDGDWHDACAMPDGASLLVVGDVAGSGLAAMTAAARLRYAVRAYAALDMSPAQILVSVNRMLCSLEPERTATLVVARYEPGERRLRWAAAGQAAPVRYQQGGGAQLLPGPLGLPVGAAPQVTYQDSTVDLQSGDRLLLYTDGLVGGRGTDLVGALEVLLDAGAHAGRDDLAALVSHVVDALHVGPDADMGAMLVRVTG